MAVTINNREYGWGDIELVLLGRTVLGVTTIEYTTKKEKQLVYAAGRSAMSIQHGKRSTEGTIKITQSELDALNAAAREKGYKDILDIELDIVISYIPDDKDAITVDKIVCASFSELPKGMSEGDFSSEHSLPFVALDIEYNTK